MKLLVTGGGGQLGSEVVAATTRSGIECIDLSREDLDVSDLDAVIQALEAHRPDAVVNAAAYTDVDSAEEERDQAFRANHDGPLFLATACAEIDTPLIHVSTDYVFDGHGVEGFREDDAPNPVNVYGATKLAGEIMIRQRWSRHVIVRTSSLFGASGHNFVRTMMRLFLTQGEVEVIQDHSTVPTPAGPLAAILVSLARLTHDHDFSSWGTYHLTGDVSTTWLQFAREIHEEAGRHIELRTRTLSGIDSSARSTAAPRPAHSVLDCSKITEHLGVSLPAWRPAMRELVQHFCALAAAA